MRLSIACRKVAVACLFALSVPGWAATSQYIFGSQAGQAAPTSGQSWVGLMPRNDVNVWAATPNTGTSYALMPTSGTFSSLCVNLTTAPGTGASWTWTLFKSGFDEPVSVTISGTQTQACDSVHTQGFIAGDLVALHVTPSSGPAPASTYASWYIVQTPVVPGETILFGSQQAASSQYLSLSGNSSSLSAEPAMATIIPTAGTVTRFIAEFVGTASSVTATLDQNESATPLSAALTNSGTFIEQTGNLSVSAGDVLDVNETGITANSAVYASAVFVPSVAGQFVIPTWRNAVYNADPLFYLPLTGRSNDNLQPTEAQAQQIGGNLQIQSAYVLSTVAPGSGAQYAFTLRKNGANTTLNPTLSGTSLTACTTSLPVAGCSTGSAVTVNNLDLLDTSVAPTGSPASMGLNGVAVSYLAFVPQLTFTAQPPATATAGTVLSPVVVQLQDANGNPITGSSASVTISSSPAGVGGTLTATAVNGVATFNNLSFNTTGTYTLLATVAGLGEVTSSVISIGASAPSKLVFATQPPATGTAGTALSPVVVQVEDANGNPITGSTAQVTIGSNPAGVSGTLAVTAVNGVATFSNLLFTTSGSYTLSAASPGLTGANSSSVSIGAGTASKLAFTTQPPATGTVGTALNSVVQVEDANGNLVTASSAPVTISSSPAGVSGTLTANAVNGVAIFSNLVFNTPGTYSLSAASSGLIGAASSSVLIVANRPTSQYIFGNQAVAAVPTSSQSWVGLMPRDESGLFESTPSTGNSYSLMPTTGTFSSLCVNLTTAPGSGASWTWALYKNGSDQPISVTVSGAQTQACDLVDTAGFVPGDLVNLHVTPSSGIPPATTYASWYIVQTPQVPGETILFASMQLSSPYYLSLGGNSGGYSLESDMATIIPTAGTVTKYAAEYVGTGSSVTAVLDQNESPTPVSASLASSGVFVQRAVSQSVSPGDVFDINQTGITATSAFYASMVFVPNVPGQFVIPSYRNGAETENTATTYLVLSGRSVDAFVPNESLAQQIGGNLQIQGIFARTTVAPGNGAQWAYTLRDNGANTLLNTTMTGTNLTACTTAVAVTGCASGSAVVVNNFDLLDTAAVPTGSPAISSGTNGVSVSYLAYVPWLAFTTQPPASGTTGTALSSVVVQVEDANGNPITGFSAPVTIGSSPAGVSGTLTVNAVNGVATFNNLLFSTPGNYTLTASVTGLVAVASSSISIGAGAANTLVFTTQPPATGTAGTALSSVVQVKDANGNLVTGFSAPVTISSSPAGVSGTLTVTAVNGVATFSNLLFSASGNYTLLAASGGVAGATSSPVSIGAGVASKLVFSTGPPSSGTTGTALSPVVVQVQDGNGNLVTGSSALVTIGSIPAGISGALTASAVNGVATFSNLLFTASGSYTLSAASSGLTGATSSAITIGSTRPTSQYIFGSQSDIAAPTAGQSWTGLMPRDDANVWKNNATTGDSYALMPTTGTFSSLCVTLATAPGAGASWTWTLFKNGSDQSISVKISGAQKQACDSVNTSGFVPGDLVALHVTPSASPAPASTFSSWYIVQTPQVPGETILFGSQQAGNAQYLSFAGNSSSSAAEPGIGTILPTAGTVTKFIAEYVGTGSAVKAALDRNLSATSLSASLASGVFVQQTGNLSVSAGDVLDVNETGITALSAVYASIVFVPNVAGQFAIPTWRNPVSNANPLFYLSASGRSPGTPQTTEALVQQIGGNVQIQGMYVRSLGAPGNGTQYVFTLRDNNANTALNTTLSGTNLTACTTSAPATGCTTGSAVAVNNLELMDTSVVPTGSPAATTVSVSYLAYQPQLIFTTQPPATGAAGTVLSPVVVQLQDNNGNAITGSKAQVTISSSPAGVSGTLTANAVNGVATFNNLVFNSSNTYSLTASASGLTPIGSSPISISGAAAPIASLNPALAFPNTLKGTTSPAMAATLSNTGTAPLNNIVASIGGANPGDFALTTGANACGATLAAGSSCSIYVTFTPVSAASFAATLSVADNASGSPQTVTLSGAGTAPIASLSPALAFSNTLTGATSSAMAATLSNTGTGPLNNIVASIAGTNPGDFALTTGANACGATLAAGSSCSIYVTFTPASAASFAATLSVADSASGSPQTVVLSGTGTALSVSETNSASFTQGQNGATYTVTVANNAAAGNTNGTVTLTQTLPTGLTLVSMAGTGWSCTGAVCTRSDVLNAGASYPAVTVTVNVAANATSPQAAQVSVSGGGAGTANATDNTTIIAVPVLSVSETNASNFTQGQNGATYTVTVANNAAAGSTNGTVTLTQTLPTGLTLVSMAGTGWSCAGAVCTRSDVLNAGASYPAVTVTVNVAANATSPQAAQVSVSGGGALGAATATDNTVIQPNSAVLSVSETSAASFTIGQSGATYTDTVSNAAGAGPTAGTVTLTETLPSSLTLVSMSGNGWSCAGAVCTRSDVLAAGASYPAVTVTVNVSLVPPSSITSQATVSGGGSVSATVSDTVTTSPQATANFTLTNQGPDAVSFTGILLTGESYTNNVGQTNNCPSTIGVGVSCNFNLTFNAGSPNAFVAADWAQYGQYAAADQQLIAGAPDPSRLVFIGDSITLSWDQPSPYGQGSLQAVKPFVNRGITGQTTEQMLVRFWEDVVKLKPAVVHIFGGTNDMGGNTGPETNAEIVEQLASMTTVAQANGIKVLIASVTPVVNLSGGNAWTPSRPNSQIVALNQSIQALCQQTGAVYVDYFSALVDPNTGAMNVNLTVDGLHPNTAGFAAMVPVVQSALATLGY